jgi:hypothetical protein
MKSFLSIQHFLLVLSLVLVGKSNGQEQSQVDDKADKEKIKMLQYQNQYRNDFNMFCGPNVYCKPGLVCGSNAKCQCENNFQ